MPRYWVGLDQGSGATKACLLDRRGRLRRLVTLPVRTRYPAPGRAEQDAEALARSVRLTLDRVLRGIAPAAVGAVGIACQRSTFLFWDADTGRALTPAISWQDRRAESLCRSLSRHEDRIRRRTGLLLSPHYAASKIRWFLDRSPDLRRRVERGKARLGTLDAYLLDRLTGGAHWSTDPTHAARTLLMDLRTLDWDPFLLELFRVPVEALPPIRPTAYPVGEIPVRGAFLPLSATVGDQQAALIGLGCGRAGEAAINYGTGAFVVVNTGTRILRLPGLLTSVAWSSRATKRYLVEGTINAAGTALEWIGSLVGRSPHGLRGFPDLDQLPLVIPAFSGLGAPYWVGAARAALLGLDLRTGGADLMAATLAGIGCRVREILEAMKKGGLRPDRIVTGGGLAHRPFLLRLQATLLGRTILRAAIAEGTARGAALLAGHALGHWRCDREPRLAVPVESVAPSRSAEPAERYYRRFRRAAAHVARTGAWG